MIESEAKTIIETAVKDLLGQDNTVALVSRKPLSRLEHEALYAVIFKHDEDTEASIVSALKKLSYSNPDLEFAETEVNDKFKMEFTAVLMAITIKG